MNCLTFCLKLSWGDPSSGYLNGLCTECADTVLGPALKCCSCCWRTIPHYCLICIRCIHLPDAHCGENGAINRKQFTIDLCIQLFQGCNSTPSEVLSNGGCYSHTSLRLQRMAWDAESALSSPHVCTCTCMLNIESKDYLWRCTYRIFFFLVLILGTRDKIDDISIFVLYRMKLVPGCHFCLGRKIAVSFVKTLMH